MKNKPIFFAVNKFDEADTCSAQEWAVFLGLEDLKKQNWIILETIALTGQNINKGFTWVTEKINEEQKRRGDLLKKQKKGTVYPDMPKYT